jgi:hypothetical protein
LIDQIKREGLIPSAPNYSPASIHAQQWCRNNLGQVPVFVIDNVVEYFFQRVTPPPSGRPLNIGDILDEWPLSSFPCLAPPFPQFIMEFRLPADFMAVQRAAMIARHGPQFYFPTLVGLAFHACGVDDAEQTLTSLGERSPLDFSQLIPDETRWLLFVTDVYRIERRCVGPLTCWLFCLDSAGKLLCLPANENRYWFLVWAYLRGGPLSRDSEQGIEISLVRIHSFIYPTFLALSFLHCKNVVVERSAPPEKLNRRHQKQHGVPLTRYHVLNIEPMRKILSREGQVQTLGLRRALHICRGYFADYTKGAGLFGRHHGVFWVPQHTRGSAQYGTIQKDYAVRASIPESSSLNPAREK